MALEEYCEVINATLECTMGKSQHWCATSLNIHVVDSGCLVREFGLGTTPDKALREYAKVLAGKRIAVNVNSDRREFVVPENVK